MRIQFEFTIDELVDLQERVAERSKVARKWRRQGMTLTAVLGGLIWGVPSLIFLYFIFLASWALLFAFVPALIGAAIALSQYHGKARQQYHKYFREKYGDRNTFPFELELSAAGICTRQFGVQSTYEWSLVEEMTTSESSVEFDLFGGGAISVKRRAFASAIEQQAFIDAARQYLNVSRTSSNWLRAG